MPEHPDWDHGEAVASGDPAARAPVQTDPQVPSRRTQLASFSSPGSDLDGLDMALDAMQVGIFEYGDDGIYRFSERCKMIWGFASDEEVTPERIRERVHPEDRQVTDAMCQSLKLGGTERFSFEHRLVLPDGAIRWVQVSGQKRRGDARGCGAMHDITARKDAEAELYARSSQLQAFVAGAPVPIAILDDSMRYVAASDRYAQERGLAVAELIGRSMYEIFPRLPQHWHAVHHNVLNGATESCDQDLFVSAEGREEWVRWEMRPWYRADNEVGGIILFAELITQIIRAQQALRDSQERLALALHAGMLGVYDRDLTTGDFKWDARARRLWGFDPEETITDEKFLQAIHPEDRERIDKALREASSHGGGIIVLEFRMVNRADGSLHWIASNGRVHGEDGHVRCVGVLQDITDRKRAELELARSAEELRRADERKNVYLATLSHELRNPLAPIRTAAHLLASPRLKPEQLRWASQVISRQTSHMATLLEDLLDITRVSHGKMTLRRRSVPLWCIVQPALESAHPLIEERHHELKVTLPREPLTVHADPHRLSQVLSNLLTNAGKYTHPGGHIELTITDEDWMLVMRVRDNGIGIPAEALEKIFTMFWQADGRSDHCHGGLGIGLAFVEGIVKLHGGSIEARSDGPGRGSEIIVRLPVIERATHGAAAAPGG
jgi:PAS domain S-box-containing protein